MAMSKPIIFYLLEEPHLAQIMANPPRRSQILHRTPLFIGCVWKIEFLFRDAKQFTGLPVCVHRTGKCDCQARDQKRLNFHFNASLTTLNLAKAELTLTQKNRQSVICSMASVKALYFNQHYLDRITRISCLRAARRQVGLDPTWIKKRPEYQRLREYGKIAA